MKNGIMSLRSFIIILILVFFISILGATFAYFAATQTSNAGDITGNAAMINLTLNVNKILPQENGKIVPQLPNRALENAIKNNCVDDNDNVVCQVYKISITNGSSATVIVDGKMSFYGDDNLTVNLSDIIPHMKWMLISSFDENNISTTNLGSDSIKNADSSNRNFVSNVSISPSGIENYYVVVWLNEEGSEQSGQNQTFRGKVSFIASNGSGVTATFS
ncbi:MAG: hypothetical protein IJI49_03095 [Bacilli bacterium]|nr:hypothetical protein [Bacilli bacterium]